VNSFKDPKMAGFFLYLLSDAEGDSLCSRPNNIVVPGVKMGLAMGNNLMPVVEEMMPEKIVNVW